MFGTASFGVIRQPTISFTAMAKFAIFVFLAALVAISSAATIPGVKDFIGNYYDPYTRQYSSAITGKVYNTAPFVAPYIASYSAYVPPVEPVVAPVAAPVAAPVVAPYYGAAYAYGAYPYGAAYVAPILKK